MPPRTRNNETSALGDSWVVGSENREDSTQADPEQSVDDDTPAPPALDPTASTSSSSARLQRGARNLRKSSEEPQMIMPSISEESLPPPPPPRRRRASKKPAQVAGNGHAATPTKKKPVGPPVQQEEGRALEYVMGAVGFVSDIVGKAFNTLKTPLAYLLAVYMVFGLLLIARNILFERITAAVSPVCRIPGLSYIVDLPFCTHPVATNYSGGTTPPAEFDRLAAVQSQFEDLLLLSAESAPIPVQMRRSELAIRDLRATVRYSALSSKNELVLEFDEFVEGVKKTALAYQRFIALGGRAVDRILPTARVAARAIERQRDPEARRGLISSISGTLLAPFQPLDFGGDIVLEQYLLVLHVTRREVESLLDEARNVLALFERLEENLDAIHAIAVRDTDHAQAARNDVLARIWTRLGANRSRLFDYEKDLRLLSHVGSYRRTAMTHLGAAITELQGMNAELEDLDERVRTGREAEVDGSGMPLEARLESLEMGVARLDATNRRARKARDDFQASKERKAIWEAELDQSRLIDAKRHIA